MRATHRCLSPLSNAGVVASLRIVHTGAKSARPRSFPPHPGDGDDVVVTGRVKVWSLESPVDGPPQKPHTHPSRSRHPTVAGPDISRMEQVLTIITILLVTLAALAATSPPCRRSSMPNAPPQ